MIYFSSSLYLIKFRATWPRISGNMTLVPCNMTLRETTLERLERLLFQQSVIAVFISLLLPTSPYFIRVQFKTLKLVFVISYFYKALVQFSSHSIELILKQFFHNLVLVLDRLESCLNNVLCGKSFKCVYQCFVLMWTPLTCFKEDKATFVGIVISRKFLYALYKGDLYYGTLPCGNSNSPSEILCLAPFPRNFQSLLWGEGGVWIVSGMTH